MSNQEAIALLRNLEDSLDAYCELNDEGKTAFRMAIAALELFGNSEQLPPAQPEIIRCKDCKHWREGTAFSYCDKLYGMGVLDALDYMVAEDDYCSMAERRTDELGNS